MNNQPIIHTADLSPHSIEAEEAVLGAILINPDALYEVLTFLNAEDFFIVRHAWIWEATLSLHERHDPIDYMTIVNELEQVGRLAEIGGAAYILTLINKTPSALNVEGYGRIVERMALRRRLIEAAGQIARIAHSEETDIDEVISGSESALFDATKNRQSETAVSVPEAFSNKYDRITWLARNQDAPPLGITTGWDDIDKHVRCLPNGEIIVLAGTPGTGKTTAATEIFRHNFNKDIPGVFFSLEMSTDKITDKLVAAQYTIDVNRLEDGKLISDEENEENDEVGRLTDGVNEWKKFERSLIDDDMGRTAHSIASQLKREVMMNGVQYAIIDYVQLMNHYPPGVSRRMALTDAIGLSLNVLKSAAKELNIPIIVLSQVSRACESRPHPYKRPVRSDLAESAKLERVAHTIVFLYRHWRYDKTHPANDFEFIIAKQRNGNEGTLHLIAELQYSRFQNAVRKEINLDDDHLDSIYRGGER